MEHELAERECVPCRGGAPPLTAAEIAPLLAQLNEWEAVNRHHLRKAYAFPDFRAALNFVNRVAGALSRYASRGGGNQRNSELQSSALNS